MKRIGFSVSGFASNMRAGRMLRIRSFVSKFALHLHPSPEYIVDVLALSGE